MQHFRKTILFSTDFQNFKQWKERRRKIEKDGADGGESEKKTVQWRRPQRRTTIGKKKDDWGSV